MSIPNNTIFYQFNTEYATISSEAGPISVDRPSDGGLAESQAVILRGRYANHYQWPREFEPAEMSRRFDIAQAPFP